MTPTLITYHETSCYHMVSVSALFPPVGCLPSYIVPWFPSSLTHYRELLNSDTISSLIETSSGFLRPQTNHGTNTGSQAPNGLAFADAQLHPHYIPSWPLWFSCSGHLSVPREHQAAPSHRCLDLPLPLLKRLFSKVLSWSVSLIH